MLSRRAGIVTSASCTASATTCQRRSFIKGMFGGNKGSNGANGEEGKNASDARDGGMGNMFPGGLGSMPGFNAKMMKEFMSQPADKQVQMMRTALEMQKKFGGSIPGLGKVNAKNVEFMESMINKMEGSIGKPSETSQATTPTGNSTVATPSAPPKANSFRSPSGPTLEELRKINLGAEIEELFAELGSMRNKRNHYRSELEKKEQQLSLAQKEADENKAKAADLRVRLGASENTIRIMNTESLQLKASLQSLKAIQDENKKLNVKISALQSNDTIPLREKIAQLEAELNTSQDSIKSLQRKLDRMRRRDMIAQFSLLLTDVRTSVPNGGLAEKKLALGATSEAHHQLDENYHSELFASVQEQFDTAAASAWATCAPSATTALLASCQSFIQNCVGRGAAKLDAHVTLAPSVDESQLEEVAKTKGYHIKKQIDGTYVVSLPSDAATPSLLGPFGFLSTYAHEHSTVIASVHPWISEELARNTKRASTSTTTTRSSGPGGQAANTAETQVSITFSIDDERLFVSEAQDTRSQVTNKSLAESRLFDEKLSHYNKKVLSQVRLDVPTGSGITGNVITSGRWADTTAALRTAIESLSKVDKAVISCTFRAITGQP